MNAVKIGFRALPTDERKVSNFPSHLPPSLWLRHRFEV